MADDPVSAPTNPDPESPAVPPRRKVYQPTLFPERRRRRASPWVVIPVLLIVLLGLLYFLLSASHRVRFVPTAGEVVYASDAGSPGVPHLWTCRFDGTGAHRLLSGSAAEMQPAFGPGGSRIVFVSNRDAQANQIYVADADGKNVTELTRSAGAKADPAWAPSNAGLLGYLAGGALYDMPVGGEGGGADRILPPPPNTRQAQASDQALTQAATVSALSYAWSPAKNGGLAAVEDKGEYQVLAVAPNLNAVPIDAQQTPQGSVPLAAAAALSLGWSPDGSLLAVAALGVQGLPGGAATSGILLFEPDGSPVSGRPPVLMKSASVGPQNPVFSPDGTQIVFEAWNEPSLANLRRLGLYIVPTDASAAPRLLFRGDASQAKFTPDGSAIFFLAARPGGGHDLCRIAPDGSGFARLISAQGDVSGFSLSPQTGGGQ